MVVIGGGAAIVIVRSVVVVCVAGANPQAASKAEHPRSAAANTSRMPDFVSAMMSPQNLRRIGRTPDTN